MSDAGRIAEVLEIHQREPGHRDMAAHCTCGWKGTPPGMRDAQHRTHVAAALEPVIRGRERVAWNEGRLLGKDVCAWAIGNRPDTERPDETNPYDDGGAS